MFHVLCGLGGAGNHHRRHHRYYEQRRRCSARLLGFNWLLRYTGLASFAGLVIEPSLRERLFVCNVTEVKV